MAPLDPLLLAYLPAAALLTLSPGPDMAVVARNALEGGPRGAAATAVGTAAGLLLHGTLVAAGLAAVLARRPDAFRLVQLAGALVLVALGALSLRRAARPTDAGAATEPGPTGGPAVPWPAQGFLTNALNPKVAVFYLAFLPQFVGPGHDPAPRVLLLAGIHAAMNLAWLPAYGAGLARAGDALGGRAGRGLEAAAGLLLAGLGAALLLGLA